MAEVELRGYLLFGLLFLFTIGLIIFLAFLFAELLTVTGVGRLAVDFLLLIGSTGGLFFFSLNTGSSTRSLPAFCSSTQELSEEPGN